MKGSTWLKIGLLLLAVGGVWWVLKVLGMDLSQVTPERVRTFIL